MSTDYRQFESFTQLSALLKFRAPLNPTRGWAASPDFLLEVVKEVLKSDVKAPTILELGSGVSTVVLGYLIERFFPEGRVISLEHDFDYYLETKESLELHSLNSVFLHFAPFKYYRLDGRSYRFYDISPLKELKGKIDFVVVDGPPETTQRLARYPALPLLLELLSPRFTLFLDDANRPDEAEAALKWKGELELYSSKELPTEKGMLILKPFSGERPFFSICIPTFNRKAFLKEALESVASQTYKNYEVIVYDDGSTDGTQRVVEEFKKKINNLRYFRGESNRGRPFARNFCVEKAGGDWVVWLDDDDKLGPELLSRYAQSINTYPEVKVFYPKEFLIEDGKGQRLWLFRDFYRSDSEILRYMVDTSPIPNPGSCIKREVFEEFGLYDSEFLRAQDYEFWSRLFPAVERKGVGYLGVVYRLHSSNVSGVASFEFTDTSYESVVKRRLLGRWSLRELLPEFPTESEALNYFGQALRLIGDYLNAGYYFWLSGDITLAVDVLREGGILTSQSKLQKLFSLLLKEPQRAVALGKKLGKSYYLIALANLLKASGDERWRNAAIKAFVVNPLLGLPPELNLKADGAKEAAVRVLRVECPLEERKGEFLNWVGGLK